MLAVAPCPVERSVLDSASAAVGPEIDSGSVLLKVNELRNLSLRRVARRDFVFLLLLLLLLLLVVVVSVPEGEGCSEGAGRGSSTSVGL